MKKNFILQIVLALIFMLDGKAEGNCQDIIIIFPNFGTMANLTANWWGSADYTPCEDQPYHKYGESAESGKSIVYHAKIGTSFRFGPMATSSSPVNITVGQGDPRWACFGLLGFHHCEPCAGSGNSCIEEIKRKYPSGGTIT